MGGVYRYSFIGTLGSALALFCLKRNNSLVRGKMDSRYFFFLFFFFFSVPLLSSLPHSISTQYLKKEKKKKRKKKKEKEKGKIID